MAKAAPRPKPPRRSNKERSATTRTRLLEATVACLNEVGYAATTGKLAIERAGLSRGAALHQFPSRVDLILETALYTIEAQNEFRAGMRRPDATAQERLMDVLDIVWESWKRPHAIALLEIMIGSRSDPELAERYPAISQQIEQMQHQRFWDLAKSAGITDRRASDVMVVLGVSTMRGLAIQRMFAPDPAMIDEAFAVFRKMRTQMLRDLIAAGEGAGKP